MEFHWIATFFVFFLYTGIAHDIWCPKFFCTKNEELPTTCAWKEYSDSKLQYKFKPCSSSHLVCDWRLIHERKCSCVEYMSAQLYPGEFCQHNEECISGNCSSQHCVGAAQNEKCEEDIDCNAGLFCFERKCNQTISRGDSCNATHRCGAADICEFNRCTEIGSKKIGEKAEKPSACESFFISEEMCHKGPTLLSASSRCPENGRCIYQIEKETYEDICVCGMSKSGMPKCLLGAGDTSLENLTLYIQSDLQLNQKCHVSRGPLCQHSSFAEMGYGFYQAYIAYQERIRSSLLEDNEDCVDRTVNALYSKCRDMIRVKEREVGSRKYIFLAIAVAIVGISMIVLLIWYCRKKIYYKPTASPNNNKPA